MGNGRNIHSLDFPLGDMLMMMEAMRLAGNTAMMYPKPVAEARFREYQERFNALVPEPARQFSGFDLCEINIALQEASSFHVFIARPTGRQWWYNGSGRLTVQVDGDRWSTKNSNIEHGDEVFNAVLDLLTDLAPMDCEPLLEEPQEHPESS